MEDIQLDMMGSERRPRNQNGSVEWKDMLPDNWGANVNLVAIDAGNHMCTSSSPEWLASGLESAIKDPAITAFDPNNPGDWLVRIEASDGSWFIVSVKDILTKSPSEARVTRLGGPVSKDAKSPGLTRTEYERVADVFRRIDDIRPDFFSRILDSPEEMKSPKTIPGWISKPVWINNSKIARVILIVVIVVAVLTIIGYLVRGHNSKNHSKGGDNHVNLDLSNPDSNNFDFNNYPGYNQGPSSYGPNNYETNGYGANWPSSYSEDPYGYNGNPNYFSNDYGGSYDTGNYYGPYYNGNGDDNQLSGGNYYHYKS
eukprot:988273_1